MFAGLVELQADNAARSSRIASNEKIIRFDGGYMLQAPLERTGLLKLL